MIPQRPATYSVALARPHDAQEASSSGDSRGRFFLISCCHFGVVIVQIRYFRFTCL